MITLHIYRSQMRNLQLNLKLQMTHVHSRLLERITTSTFLNHKRKFYHRQNFCVKFHEHPSSLWKYQVCSARLQQPAARHLSDTPARVLDGPLENHRDDLEPIQNRF